MICNKGADKQRLPFAIRNLLGHIWGWWNREMLPEPMKATQLPFMQAPINKGNNDHEEVIEKGQNFPCLMFYVLLRPPLITSLPLPYLLFIYEVHCHVVFWQRHSYCRNCWNTTALLWLFQCWRKRKMKYITVSIYLHRGMINAVLFCLYFGDLDKPGNLISRSGIKYYSSFFLFQEEKMIEWEILVNCFPLVMLWMNASVICGSD